MSNTLQGRPDVTAPLAFVISAAARKMAKFYGAALAESPVTPSQLFFLRQLWREDGLPLSEMRERAQLDATSATWLTDQLERSELITRRRGAPDRRVVRVWLTEAGRALRDDLQPEIERWEEGFTEVLRRYHSRADVQAFRAVLETMISVLPDGDDLWAELSTQWDTALEALRDYLEMDE